MLCASLPLASTGGRLTVVVWNVTEVPSSTRPPGTALSVWPLLTSALPPAVRVVPPNAKVAEPSATAVTTAEPSESSAWTVAAAGVVKVMVKPSSSMPLLSALIL